MIRGIGTDLFSSKKLLRFDPDQPDPFYLKTFTPDEIDQARSRPDPRLFLASRFAAKEAVFKSLKIDGDRIRLNEIEIFNEESGAPAVRLLGRLKEIAKELGIVRIEVSLSTDAELATAFALSFGQ